MKNLLDMSTPERYEALEKASLDEILGKEELPVPEEVLKAREQKLFANAPNNVVTSPNLITESFYLPSKNLLYGENFDGHINLRMFTTKEERIRLSSRTSFLETMVTILNNCISTTNGIVIDTKLLTEFDFIYVMYMSRIVSYGPMYPITVRCPHCDKTFKYTANLDELEVKYLDDNFSEPINIGKLPRTQDELELRFLRVMDRIEVEKEAQEILIKQPDYQGDPTFNGNIERRIVTVNGKELNDWEKKKYVEELPALDVQYITHKLNKMNLAGISNIIEPQCPHCQSKFDTILSIDSTFFRPEFDD